MGMYTEIVFRARINKNTIDKDIFNIFDYMFNPNSELEVEDLVLPDDVFFKCERWGSIGKCSSYYHHPNEINDWYCPKWNRDGNIYIFSRSDLKNYDNEIELFFNWIDTLGIFSEGEYMGYSLYEEDNEPRIYISKKGKNE